MPSRKLDYSKNVFLKRKRSKLPLVLFMVIIIGVAVWLPQYLGEQIKNYHALYVDLIKNTLNIDFQTVNLEQDWFNSSFNAQLNPPVEGYSLSLTQSIAHSPLILASAKNIELLPKNPITTRLTFNSAADAKPQIVTLQSNIIGSHSIQTRIKPQSLSLSVANSDTTVALENFAGNLLFFIDEERVTGGLKTNSLVWSTNTTETRINNITAGLNFLASPHALLQGDVSYAAENAVIKLAGNDISVNGLGAQFISIVKGDLFSFIKRLEFREINNGFLVAGPGAIELEFENIKASAIQAIGKYSKSAATTNNENEDAPSEQSRKIAQLLKSAIADNSRIKVNEFTITTPPGDIVGSLQLNLATLENESFDSWLPKIKLDANLSVPVETVHNYLAATAQYNEEEIEQFMQLQVQNGFFVKADQNYQTILQLRQGIFTANGKTIDLTI